MKVEVLDFLETLVTCWIMAGSQMAAHSLLPKPHVPASLRKTPQYIPAGKTGLHKIRFQGSHPLREIKPLRDRRHRRILWGKGHDGWDTFFFPIIGHAYGVAAQETLPTGFKLLFSKRGCWLLILESRKITHRYISGTETSIKQKGIKTWLQAKTCPGLSPFILWNLQENVCNSFSK